MAPRSSQLAVASGFVAAAACTPAPPPAPPPPVVIAPAPPATAEVAVPPPPWMVSVTAARRPARLAIDGDLSEWGALLPAEPTAEEKKRRGGKPDPNPREASSHVALALTGDGAYLAADLGEAARDGLWLGIGVTPPDMLPVGEYQHAESMMPFFACQRAADESQGPDPKAAAECKALLDQHASDVAEHEQRFRKVYRIDRAGLRVVDAGGALAPVPGAIVAFGPGPKGATVEASIPLLALPRVAEAPVAWLGLVARAATVAPKELPPPEDWVASSLPEPVGFEPFAELRAAVFENERRSGAYSPVFSYQPGLPARIETMTYPGDFVRGSVAVRDGAVYTKKLAVGDVEIGIVEARRDLVAVFHEGAFVDLYRPWGSILGIRERDGEIHVLSYGEHTWTDNWTTTADWAVIAVGPDGKAREEVLEEPPRIWSWERAEEFHARDLATFGVRGGELAGPDQKPRGLERLWRWDKAKRKYTVKVRSIPLPAQKKKR